MSQSPPCIDGPDLAERLFTGAVEPLLERFAPGLPVAAVLIGSRSDVLGLDTERAMDHNWVRDPCCCSPTTSSQRSAIDSTAYLANTRHRQSPDTRPSSGHSSRTKARVT